MVVITREGYFECGAWIKGLHPSMIGKRITRLYSCRCPAGYDDYSHCFVGYHGYDMRDNESCILKKIYQDGSLLVEWLPSIFPEGNFLEPWWNDGNWIEFSDIEKYRSEWIDRIKH